MRLALVLSAIGVAVQVSAVQAQSVQGNDTGGIIPWSCENEAVAHEVTAAYCGSWNKYPRITSVHRQYGDYITFQCLWAPRIAPYAIPAVRTRTVCRTPGYGPAIRTLN